MLSFEEKRSVLRSFPELKEIQMSNGRYNYELQFIGSRKRIVAREFSPTGNGYVFATPESKQLSDDRGWIKIKDFDQAELRDIVRRAINSFRTKNLIEKSDRFLQENGILPLNSAVWRHFEIIHKAPIGTEDREAARAMIAEQVGDSNGLYIYTQPDGTVLYVGKAKPLRNRLLSHYVESFQTVKGDTRDNRWHRFFSSHQGPVIVHWMELEDENMRMLVEHMLTMQLNPEFLCFR